MSSTIMRHTDSNNNFNMADAMNYNIKKLPPLVMPTHGTNMDNVGAMAEVTSENSSRKRPNQNSFTPMINSKRTCLPYGYCYDTSVQDTDLWLIDDDDLKPMAAEEEDLWMYSDDRTPDSLLGNNPWISTNNRKRNQSKVMRDVGPTLAQLNSGTDVWDNLDLDELLSCTSAVSNNSGTTMSQQQLPKNNYTTCGPSLPIGSTTGKLGNQKVKKEKENIEQCIKSVSMNELTDPKLQANVEYLQSLLSNPNVNQSLTSSEVSVTPDLHPNPSVSSSSTSQKSSKKSVKKSNVPTEKLVQVKTEPIEPDPTVPTLLVEKQEEESVSMEELVAKVPKKKKEEKLVGPVQVKQEPMEIESPEIKSSDETGKKASSIKKGTSADTHRTRRTRNSNSQCTEKSNGSSNDEGFVEEPIENTLEQVEEDIDEDDNESEVVDSDDESFYGDYEAKDLLGASTSDDQENRWALIMGRSRKGGAQRYFWQYNVQAKGPKTTGSKSSSSSGQNSSDVLDPHVLGEVSDPVFAPDCAVAGVKHAGKARRGDGNDLTPNPRKLLMIGLELKKLSKTINDLTPVSDVPVAARNKTRKEKNKLASRACRLKKKAQHEANKIKLFGLQNEHLKMLKLLSEIKTQVRKIVAENDRGGRKVTALTNSMANLFNEGVGKVIVAGNTAEYVNSILDNVAAGQTDGGLMVH